MASKKKKPSLYSANAARWYLDTGKELARERGLYRADADVEERANYLAEKRATKLATLARDVKNIREYFRGFEAGKGFSLQEIKRWPAARVKKVEQYSEYLRHLQSQPFKRVIPKTKKQRASAIAYTGQQLDNQRAYVMHVPDDERDEVSINRDGEIIVERELKNKEKTTVYDVYYLYMPLIGWRPATWDDVVSATEELLPFLPDDDSLYFLQSELHGMIGSGATKRMLMYLVRRYATEYAMKDFAGTIIGLRRVFSSTEGRMLAERKLSYQQKRLKQRQEAWNALRRKVRKHFGKRR